MRVWYHMKTQDYRSRKINGIWIIWKIRTRSWQINVNGKCWHGDMGYGSFGNQGLGLGRSMGSGGMEMGYGSYGNQGLGLGRSI